MSESSRREDKKDTGGTGEQPQLHRDAGRRLQQELSNLFPIPDEAATQYAGNVPKLSAQVDEQVLRKLSVSDLIGACPVEVIRTNHRNHGRFMAAVFVLDLPSLLMQVVPWAYRVYTARGVSADYFRAELAAWIDAVQSQLDPAHARPICRLYRWMIDHHDTMQELARNVTQSSFVTGDWSSELESLLGCLLKGDSTGARRMAEESAPEAGDLPKFYVDRVQPVMYRIGDLWAEGEVSVAQEHMATALISRIMAATYQRFELFKPSKGKVVVACATDEFHEIGARTVADLLELDGWDVMFIGANVPEEDFHSTVVDVQPEIVALSAAVPSHLLRMKGMVDGVRAESSLAHTRTMVGGLALNVAPEASDKLAVDGSAQDGRHAQKLAHQWWEEGIWD